MTFISRGFRGRRQPEVPAGRLPPAVILVAVARPTGLRFHFAALCWVESVR
jgi:hypothetical protein